MARGRKINKKNFIHAFGRRKEASARVRLYSGSSQSLINGVSFEEYFPGKVNKMILEKPFKLTDTLGKYYVTAKVEGGGKEGQLEACVFAISRALAKESEEFKKILRKAGLLTRDARVRERRKVGTGGKARRIKQSPKR